MKRPLIALTALGLSVGLSATPLFAQQPPPRPDRPAAAPQAPMPPDAPLPGRAPNEALAEVRRVAEELRRMGHEDMARELEAAGRDIRGAMGAMGQGFRPVLERAPEAAPGIAAFANEGEGVVRELMADLRRFRVIDMQVRSLESDSPSPRAPAGEQVSEQMRQRWQAYRENLEARRGQIMEDLEVFLQEFRAAAPDRAERLSAAIKALQENAPEGNEERVQRASEQFHEWVNTLKSLPENDEGLMEALRERVTLSTFGRDGLRPPDGPGQPPSMMRGEGVSEARVEQLQREIESVRRRLAGLEEELSQIESAEREERPGRRDWRQQMEERRPQSDNPRDGWQQRQRQDRPEGDGAPAPQERGNRPDDSM